jgi:hypothetical protein
MVPASGPLPCNEAPAGDGPEIQRPADDFHYTPGLSVPKAPETHEK